MKDDLKVLIVEDRVEFRLLLGQMLKEIGEGIKVEMVEDGATAVELIKVKKFDCVLLDYLLGDSTGSAILKEIRKVQPQIPVIVITAYYNDSIAKSISKAGASGFIAKSDLSPKTLAAALEEALSVSRSGRLETQPSQKFSLFFDEMEGMKVLVVDDTPTNITVLRNILSEAKLNISVAPNGEVALNIAGKVMPDLILMDIMMPGIDGFEACRQLKGNQATKNIPLIFISARAESEDYTKGFSLGAVDYITKPFREEEVLARVHTHLRLAQYVKRKEKTISDLNSEVINKNEALEQANKELTLAYGNEKELVNSQSRELRFHKQAIDEHSIVSIADIKGNITYVNDKFCQVSGYSRDELIGQNHRILRSDEHNLEFFKDMWNTLVSGKVWHGEIKNKNKSGGYYWVRTTIVPNLDKNKKPFQYIGIRTEITENKNLENELLRAKEEAERANHAKSDFLSSMSHELRTPLNAIMGFSQLLTMNPMTMTPLQIANIKRISSSGEHLLKLINEVLDLASIEAGKVSMSIEPLLVGLLLDDLVLLVAPMAAKKGISMNYLKNDFSSQSVMADKTRLKQVILNLFSNAIKYNRENGTVEITLEKVPENFLRLSVVDTGLGIPEDQQVGLFEAFNRLGAERTEVEGTGIGLAITKKLVDLMNGRIGFDTKLGEGTCFYIELPLCEANQNQVGDELESQQTYQPVTHQSPQSPQFHILYIEDNPANLDLVNQVLMVRENITLFSAPDARLGVDLAISHQPDLILMDINLPGMGGLEAFNVLKNNPETSKIPVIAVSANAMGRDVRSAMAAGFTDYLAKPLNIPQFLEKIDQQISESLRQVVLPKNKSSFIARKALVVEDMEDMGMLVQQFLREMGFEDITYVKSVKEGIQKLSEDSFDLILLDWFLDDDKGSTVVEYLQREKRFNDAPLIIVTSHKVGCVEAAEIGIKDHLIKPFDYEMFASCVARVLKEHY